MQRMDLVALILVLAPCGKALFELITAGVKLVQTIIESKNSAKK